MIKFIVKVLTSVSESYSIFIQSGIIKNLLYFLKIPVIEMKELKEIKIPIVSERLIKIRVKQFIYTDKQIYIFFSFIGF